MLAPTFLTYFDANYLAKGLAMITSLRRHQPDCLVNVICLDEETLRILRQLGLPGVMALPLKLIEADDPELAQAKGNRSTVEYYWTMTPTVLMRLLDQQEAGALLTYVDADLYFYASPQSIFDEMGKGSVYIHRHNFPDAYKELEVNGVFNVGLVTFRNDAEGRKVLGWWRDRCLEWCHDRREDGKMGDQKYLESFQSLSDAVVVSRNPGVGVAPWNQIGYTVDEAEGTPRVDGHPVIFYHYHAAAFLAPGALALNTDPFYRCTVEMQRLFAVPYLQALHRALETVRQVAPGFAKGFKPTGLRDGVCAIMTTELEPAFTEAFPVRVRLDADHLLGAGRQLVEYPMLRASVCQELEWEGDYPDWASAVAAAGGYDTDAIFSKVRDAAMAVRDGKALWERDSVLFHEPQCNWPLLATLMQVAAEHDGALHVLDFGGAFGSTFMQHRRELDRLRECSWHVVEQEHVVRCGQEHFTTAQLRFHRTLEDAMAAAPINVVLLSSVLQYLERPYELLRRAASLGVAIVVDRTSMLPDGERISVQHVPPSIYPASYACRWLDQRRVSGILQRSGLELSPYFQSAVDAKGFCGVAARPVRSGGTSRERLDESPRPLRVMQADDFYGAYLERFYQQRPHLAKADYKTQTKALFEDGFSAVHAVVPYLAAQGCETDYTIYNALPLQQAWARETGHQPPVSGTAWEEALLRQRIEWFRPDVLYLCDTVRFDARFLDTLSFRPRCVVGWRAADVPATTDWTGYDIMLTTLQRLLPLAESLGARRGVLFHPGMPSWIAKAVRDVPHDTDVVFVGGISPVQHVRRRQLLDILARAATAQGFSLGLHLACDERLITPAMRPHLRPPVFGLDMHRALRRGRIVFDVRGTCGLRAPDGRYLLDLGGDDSLNMRIIEGTGGGSLVLTERLAGLERYFQFDAEVAGYTDENSMMETILHYLAHENERLAIAEAGRRRCLGDYNMKNMALRFKELCVTCLPA